MARVDSNTFRTN
nr:unnamed protein product [Callosobruchus chinensis]